MELGTRILQKGLRPFILGNTVYVPTFISLFNTSKTTISGDAVLRAGDFSCEIELPVLKQKNFWNVLRTFRIFKIPIDQLGDAINTRIEVECDIREIRDANGAHSAHDMYDECNTYGTHDTHGTHDTQNKLQRRIGWQQRRRKKHTKLYYLPFSVRRDWKKGDCLHLRRTAAGNLVIMRRPFDPIEYTTRFRILESRPVSLVFYLGARLANVFARRNVIIFYEKFAEKAEEGVFELFQDVLKESQRSQASTDNPYFVIDATKQDYDRVKGSGVIPKYTPHYYWLLYRATVFIGTEIPTHLSLIRSHNALLRRHLYCQTFVFLQHGITYLKSQSLTSSYVKGREGEADYMLVSSTKEQDIIVRDLHYNRERALITGLTQFSLIDYKHINSSSDDIVTIMLTWKPYDETLHNSSAPSYYQNLIWAVETASAYVSRQNLRIIAHPKTAQVLAETSLGASLWHMPINEALQTTKLLITDYSSVCYNVFYQGGGVIFFQPDLERYEREVGPLIPRDDEYIGIRTFSVVELGRALATVIDQDGHIALESIRTTQHEQNNDAINPYHDGKNNERILQALREAGIIGYA
jgi:hypothetical protein